jgi:hypothetical protein
MMKKITLLLALLMVGTSFGQIVINELDADQTSTDTEEFIELLSATPNFNLDGYIVVLFNGNIADNLSYTTVDLSGFTTDAEGYLIIGSDAVTGVDIALGADNTIQNGADAIAIYQDDAANFPNGTPPTTTNLIDALVYGTSDPDDADLLAALGETVQYDEDAVDADIESLQLANDGTYCTALPTLRDENACTVLNTNEVAQSRFSIYPNPATNGFVNITSKFAGAKKVTVYDVLGKELINTTLTGDRLNISALNSGVYILNITQQNASVTKKLVVK